MSGSAFPSLPLLSKTRAWAAAGEVYCSYETLSFCGRQRLTSTQGRGSPVPQGQRKLETPTPPGPGSVCLQPALGRTAGASSIPTVPGFERRPEAGRTLRNWKHSQIQLQGRSWPRVIDPGRGWAGGPVGAHSPAQSAGPSPDHADLRPGSHLRPCPAPSVQAHAARMDPEPQPNAAMPSQRPLLEVALWMTALSKWGCGFGAKGVWEAQPRLAVCQPVLKSLV